MEKYWVRTYLEYLDGELILERLVEFLSVTVVAPPLRLRVHCPKLCQNLLLLAQELCYLRHEVQIRSFGLSCLQHECGIHCVMQRGAHENLALSAP